MQNEMNQLFAEGGVMQEGGTVDPVSGNDVPPGAMAEEVRDDIDAKLSEGEFVIPADVVRYIGLEKLMMMRDKAKAGLKRMAEIGQMGNAEEVPDAEALHGDEEMDDDSFSSEIDSILGEEKEQEYAKGGDVRKYADGGFVGGEENRQLYADAPIKGFEMVAMTNDAGQTIYIPFINGVAQLSVPQGYKVKSSAASTTPEPTTGGDGGATTTQPIESGGGDGGGPSDGGGTTSGPNISMTPEGPVANTISPTLGSLAGLVVGMVTGLPPSVTSQIGKAAVNQMNFAADQATMNVSVAQADTSNPANLEGITTAAATPTAPGGAQGTGGAAAAAASAAAAAAAAAGHSAESIAAASQAAATATVNGQSPADAAAAGQDAANANAADAADAEGGGIGTAATGGVGGVSGVSASDGSGVGAGVGTGGAAPGDSGDGGTGAASSAGGDGGSSGAGGVGGGDSGAGPGSGDGDGGYAKGGFVSKKKTKTASKPTSLASRRK